MRIFSKIIIFIAVSTLSLTTFAQDNEQANEKFKTECAKEWMNKSTPSTDPVAYKNLGEKYCACLVGKPSSPDAALTRSAYTCMSQIMLHDTMNSLEDTEGLENLTQEKIEKACVDKWSLLSSLTHEAPPTQTPAFCKCSAPLLNTLNDDRDNLTDAEWDKKINEIAATCGPSPNS